MKGSRSTITTPPSAKSAPGEAPLSRLSRRGGLRFVNSCFSALSLRSLRLCGESALAILAILAAALVLWSAEPIRFTDVTAAAGIKFTHNAGRTGKKWLPETMGAGCAFFDFDGDGWLDILLVNGKDLIPHGRHTTAALYRNNHNGTFTDVTRASGLDVEIYGL